MSWKCKVFKSNEHGPASASRLPLDLQVERWLDSLGDDRRMVRDVQVSTAVSGGHNVDDVLTVIVTCRLEPGR